MDGTLNFVAGSAGALPVEFAASSSDSLAVTGMVNLTNVTLNPASLAGFAPIDGSQITLIDSQGAGAVSGTFTGRADGSEITELASGNLRAYISYFGGDGNDIIISFIDSVTPAPVTVQGADGDTAFLVRIVGNTLQVLQNGAVVATFTFTNPTGSLTINLGAGNDTLVIDPSFSSGSGAGQFNATLVIDGQTGEDVVSLGTALSLTAGSLSVTSENINLNSDITATSVTLDGVNRLGSSLTIDTSAANGNITFDGTVIATGAGGQDLTLNAGSGGSVNFNDAVTRGAVAEVGGVIVIEAEHYTGREARSGGGMTNWELVPGESAAFPALFSNFRGDSYVQALPNGGGTDGPNQTPEIRYEVNITTPGTYRLIPRASGHDGGSDSMFMDVVELKDGTGGAIADWYEYAISSNSDFGSPAWITTGAFEANNAGATPAVSPEFTFATAGIYTGQPSARTLRRSTRSFCS